VLMIFHFRIMVALCSKELFGVDGWMDHSVHETNELQGRKIRQKKFFFKHIHTFSYTVEAAYCNRG
jgi:hypothetical protein